jgi:hypothetical protein
MRRRGPPTLVRSQVTMDDATPTDGRSSFESSSQHMWIILVRCVFSSSAAPAPRARRPGVNGRASRPPFRTHGTRVVLSAQEVGHLPLPIAAAIEFSHRETTRNARAELQICRI